MFLRCGLELRRGTDILVDRITEFIGFDDLGALNIGHGDFQLIQTGRDQVGNKLFQGVAGVHICKRLDPGRVAHR